MVMVAFVLFRHARIDRMDHKDVAATKHKDGLAVAVQIAQSEMILFVDLIFPSAIRREGPLDKPRPDITAKVPNTLADIGITNLLDASA